MSGIGLLAERLYAGKMGSTLFFPLRSPIKIALPRLVGTGNDSRGCPAITQENKVA